jgi:hypothetical protein
MITYFHGRDREAAQALAEREGLILWVRDADFDPTLPDQFAVSSEPPQGEGEWSQDEKDAAEEIRRWGGARSGAGRPKLADGPTIEATVSLPQAQDAKAKRLGDGNRSAGVRRALDAYTE